jgi:hypothetical protein
MKGMFITGAVVGLACAASAQEPSASRPNILWIMIEDWSNDLSCLGTKGSKPPT